MIMLLSAACVLLVAIGVAFGVPELILFIRKQKEKKLFSSIQIGDKFIEHYRTSNPFVSQWGDIFTVIEKRMGSDGLVYIKYRFENHFLERVNPLSELMKDYHYEPYTGQDKEQ